MADLVLTLVDLLPGVRVEESASSDIVLTFASVLKGDRGEKGDQGIPGKDADVADVVAALAADHSVLLVGLDGKPIVTLFGNPA